MSENPLVSVVTACYSHEPYLDDYFRGLRAQTYRNIELILTDDGSTDGSWDKVRKYEPGLKRAFPRVSLLRQDNAGIFRTAQRNYERITGEIMCILESDDYYLPAMIETSVRYLQANPEVGLLHSDTDYLYSDRIEPNHWATVGRHIPAGDVFDRLLRDNFIMTCSSSCRSELFFKHVNASDYAARGYLMGDYPKFLDLARHTRVGYIPDSLARYRVREESLSHSKDPQKMFRFWESTCNIKLDYLKKYQVSGEPRQGALDSIVETAAERAKEQYDCGRWDVAQRYIRFALKNCPAWNTSRRMAALLCRLGFKESRRQLDRRLLWRMNKARPVRVK